MPPRNDDGRIAQQRSTQPPKAPPMRRRLSLTSKQWIGLPALAAVPLLAVFGFFGERRAEEHAKSSSIALDVWSPERFRYRQVQSLDITVRNVSRRAIDTLEVSLDTAYMSRFSSVRIQPSPRRTFVVALTDVKPGEARLVSAELWGERYGRHRGRIVAAAGGDTASVWVNTLVFP
jgi:hypothetical protein